MSREEVLYNFQPGRASASLASLAGHGNSTLELGIQEKYVFQYLL